jgi:addiction module toxin, txe/yoeB family
MAYTLSFSKKFFEDLEKHKKSGQQKLLTKIEKFLSECMDNPKIGTGHPEQLKFHTDETWSRRIDQKHRLVYKIDELKNPKEVFILSAWGHYDDK